MEVVWCRICEKNRKLSCLVDLYFGCNVCGLVLRIDDFVPEPPEQHPVHTCALKLRIFHEYAVDDAMLCYSKACDSGYFHRGKIVAAICLYIGCRANEVSVMLMDLSMDMGVSVYHVGLVFVDVCEFLRDEIDGFKAPKVVDPVFFIHRFTVALCKENNFRVSLTALRILADVKVDYVGCRKRLGGLCAAAVYMAATFNGFDVLDVDNVVAAFRDVLSEKLVKCRILDLYEGFRSVAEEYECLRGEYMMENVDVFCSHDVEKFCHGFCHVCYNKFVKLSGYFSGGSDDPTSVKKCRKRRPRDLENGIAVPREDEVQILCGKKRLNSIIDFDALREVFGDDVAQSTNTKCKESNGSNNGGDAQGREDSANKDEQREEVLANKNNSVRRRFGQPKRPWVRRLGLQR